MWKTLKILIFDPQISICKQRLGMEIPYLYLNTQFNLYLGAQKVSLSACNINKDQNKNL